MAERVDVLIAGTGFGGSIAAWRLAELYHAAGVDPKHIVMLERGQRFGHTDFKQSMAITNLSKIYNLTVYPNQLPILQHGAAGVPPGLFNQNTTGRVDPLGNFTGFQDSVEYFFALAPVPQANPKSQAFSSIQLTEFTSGCPDVAASVVFFFTSVVNLNSSDNGKPLPPLKQVSA